MWSKLTGGNAERNIVVALKISIVEITNVCFPSNTEGYLAVLRMLGNIVFVDCEFDCIELDLNKTKCCYDRCKFRAKWQQLDVTLSPNIKEVIYQSCTFDKDILLVHVGRGSYRFEHSLFGDCIFNGGIYSESIEYQAPIFNNRFDHKSSLKRFESQNCVFVDKFILDYCEIEKVLLEDTYFKSKFEFKHNTVDTWDMRNTNIDGLLNCYCTSFRDFQIYQCIFEDFVVFEGCTFDGGESGLSRALFTYATFGSFVNFRNTTFRGGLDIENINLKQPPNFLNTEIGFPSSNRETYRIIKDSFDKIGNHIEANKFFALEMEKYKKELQKKVGRWPEKVVFIANHSISDFGQNYVRPVLLLFGLAVSYHLVTLGYKCNILYNVPPFLSKIMCIVSTGLNTVAMNIPPFNRLIDKDMEGMSFVTLLFQIASAILIWQTVVAVKRHTRR